MDLNVSGHFMRKKMQMAMKITGRAVAISDECHVQNSL